MTDLDITGAPFLLTALAFTLCAAVVMLGQRFPRLSGRAHDLLAVQSMHTTLTPRVGGIAIFGALILSILFVPGGGAFGYAEFVFAASILFIVGLLEDLGFDISPKNRLLTAIGASCVVILLSGLWLPRVGIPGFDVMLDYWYFGIPLTLLLTAGLANGFNLIDGVNGLASLTAMVTAIALSHIASSAGYTEMVPIMIMLAAGVFGFFLLNYPFGLIFLGDAGAYTLGFILSWFGIVILVHAPDVSPWAILLTMYWPIADTLLAMFRRFRRSADVSAPDRLHVHQMVMRALEICVLGRNRRRIANPLTTLVLSPFVAAPPLFGALFWDKNALTCAAVFGFSGLFFVSYIAAPRLIKRFRRPTCSGEDKEAQLSTA